MPPTSTTTDHVQAASVPIEISVSIVAAPCRAFRSAARWNSSPLQNTTGVASASATHSQPVNCSGGTIASDDERHRQRDRDGEPRGGRARAVVGVVPPRLGCGARVVAGGLDGGDEVVDATTRRVEARRSPARSRS